MTIEPVRDELGEPGIILLPALAMSRNTLLFGWLFWTVEWRWAA